MHKHKGDGDCVWCTLTKAMSANFGVHNPLPLDEAIADVGSILVHLIASIDDPDDRKRMAKAVSKKVRDAVPVARANGRYYTAGQNVVPYSGGH